MTRRRVPERLRDTPVGVSGATVEEVRRSLEKEDRRRAEYIKSRRMTAKRANTLP